MKHTDAEYMAVDPFQGDEAELTCRTVAIRKARKAHTCFTLDGKQDHQIQPGERYRFETARVDGSFWGSYRICLKCMDQWLDEVEGNVDD
jgi:hypothetical protein